ncbi:hypothetical protein K435DRAFT_756043 [Dendrothele bispora CBS 962.96]|uniref:MACPF domain-containing protein n=1 Tax=Dendrothele bispora (strain CBS 962.96) TaxID=1314807 RepID=A0A4S8M0V2_DENBC|nr:hypothetical protein K435DRAFT_756043 [Dendrothele bispora CBS 962.96]
MGPHRWQNVYFRHLSSHGHGYALLNPEPNRIGTEAESELERLYEEGLRVGDVGTISDSGDFVTLFNIFQPIGAPVNRVYGIPDGFQPLNFNRNLLFSTKAMYHPPNTRVCSEKAHEVKLDADGTAFALGASGPGLGVEIQFSRSHGSILSLPEGARRVDYRRLPSIRDYAAKNAESWYRFLTDEVGMDAYNGSLYVITGYDRASCYENLSFQSSSKAASLSARFSFLPIGDIGKLGLSYSSVSSSEHRVGASSPDHTLNNLSPFIRGFKIMLRTGLTKLKTPIKIVDITRADPKDVLFQGSLPSRPVSSMQSSISSPSAGPKNESLGRILARINHSNSNPSLDASDMEVDSSSSFSERGSSILDSDSEESVNWPYHPLDVINEHILKMCPDAHVAISHDQDWTSVVHELNDKLLDDSTLIGSITEKYITCCNEGCAYLMKKNDKTSQSLRTIKFDHSSFSSLAHSNIDLTIEDHPKIPHLTVEGSKQHQVASSKIVVIAFLVFVLFFVVVLYFPDPDFPAALKWLTDCIISISTFTCIFVFFFVFFFISLFVSLFALFFLLSFF